MKKENHTHKFKRHTYKSTGSKVFHCVGDSCYFKIDVGLALGKASVCWRCGDVFKIDEYSIRLARPHCKKCRIRTSVNKDASGNVSRRIANETTTNLRSRLESSVAVVEPETAEDSVSESEEIDDEL